MNVVHDRMADLAVLPVDVADLPFDVVTQDLITLHAFPARGGELDQDGVVAFGATLREQFGKGFQPDVDAFGVVEPVDAEQNFAGIAEFGANLASPATDATVAGSLVERAGIDGDGNAPTRTVRDPTWASPSRERTPTAPREVLAPIKRRARNKKFWAPPAKWNPTKSAPSRPSMISVRHGSCMNSSTGGKGMCKRNQWSHRVAGCAASGDQLQLVVLHPYGRPARRRGRWLRRSAG